MSDAGSAPIVAITGASGYLGSAVAAHFRAREWRVRLLSRGARGAADAFAFSLGAPVNADALRGVNALVHCAYDFAVTRPAEIERINVQGTLELFAAAQRAGVEHMTCVSSISAFDGCVSLYGRAKMSIEAIAQQHGAAVVRPGLIFGDPAAGMFGKLVDQVSARRLVPLIGDGSQVQFLVHRDDIVAAIAGLTIGGLVPGGAPVTVAHPQPWPLRELIRAIAHAAGRSPILVPTPARAIWAALKIAEALRVPLKFKSDSVVSLLNQNAAPDFTIAARLGIICRPFA